MPAVSTEPANGPARMRATAGFLAGIALGVAIGHCAPATAAAPASARGSDQPAAKDCVSAEEAGAHVAGNDNEAGGGGEEGAAPTFTAAFYARTFTLDASLDGTDGKQLPISIEEVCDIPKSLGEQALQLAGADGVALVSTHTRVWLDRKRLEGRAAATALDGADTAVLRVRLAPQRRWSEDEDGNTVVTFTTRRITITD
jgi:hypothetical protein